MQVKVINMNQLKSIYNSPFKDSHSHPIHTFFLIIASNELLSNITELWLIHTARDRERDWDRDWERENGYGIQWSPFLFPVPVPVPVPV